MQRVRRKRRIINYSRVRLWESHLFGCCGGNIFITPIKRENILPTPFSIYFHYGCNISTTLRYTSEEKENPAKFSALRFFFTFNFRIIVANKKRFSKTIISSVKFFQLLKRFAILQFSEQRSSYKMAYEKVTTISCGFFLTLVQGASEGERAKKPKLTE